VQTKFKAILHREIWLLLGSFKPNVFYGMAFVITFAVYFKFVKINENEK